MIPHISSSSSSSSSSLLLLLSFSLSLSLYPLLLLSQIYCGSSTTFACSCIFVVGSMGRLVAVATTTESCQGMIGCIQLYSLGIARMCVCVCECECGIFDSVLHPCFRTLQHVYWVSQAISVRHASWTLRRSTWLCWRQIWASEVRVSVIMSRMGRWAMCFVVLVTRVQICVCNTFFRGLGVHSHKIA
jgi:hypothetical protein